MSGSERLRESAAAQAVTTRPRPREAPARLMLKSRDGLLVRNTFAAYTHLFAPAVPHWAARFVAACRKNG